MMVDTTRPGFIVCWWSCLFALSLEFGNFSQTGLDIVSILNTSSSKNGELWLTEDFGPNIIPIPLTENLQLNSTNFLKFFIHAQQRDKTAASLLSIESLVDNRTFIQIISNLHYNFLVVKFCSSNCKAVHSVKFQHILDQNELTTFTVTIHKQNVELVVNCIKRIAKTFPQSFPWNLFDRVSVRFGSDKFGRKKFLGKIVEAKLSSNKSFQPCPNSSETEHIERSQTLTEEDQLNGKGIVSVDSPHLKPFKDTGDISNVITDKHEEGRTLQEQLQSLSEMVTMLKTQNSELHKRVSRLEMCKCISQCSSDGSVFQEGESWNRDQCTLCTCQNGRPVCSLRTDIPECYDPCINHPCLNGGTCAGNPGYKNYTCVCPPWCTGPECQHKTNPCVYQKEEGEKCGASPTQRYYYDASLQNCQPFLFSGCNGNPNNFLSVSQCEGACLVGACTYRTGSASTTVEYKCEEYNMATCRSLDKTSDHDVVCFIPGVTCAENLCRPIEHGCRYDNTTYKVSETFRVGCDTCQCVRDHEIVCSCSKTNVRKEIRDLTRSEMFKFQQAVQRLRLDKADDVWSKYRNMYSYFIVQSNSLALFLPWHRLFIHRMEQKLREIDCDITIPYFDFTTDVGDFSNAIVWQPNYFGGDGGSDGCVPDHPFGPPGSWRPCIRRQFNKKVTIPNAVEIAIALKSKSYLELSQLLRKVAVYARNFVGGDMALSTATNDPLFYALHSYIDMLYTRWQDLGDAVNKKTLPPQVSDVVLMPFNVLAKSVVDSAALCVKYELPSDGLPCNDTLQVYGYDGYDVHGYDRWGFDRRGYDRDGYNIHGRDSAGRLDTRNLYRYDDYNRYGYDRTGYDRRGYDRHGHDRQGYNRDGYNFRGYDRDGYDRYGFDKYGFNIYGVDRQGKDRFGNRVTSGFDVGCLDTNSLTSEVIRQYQVLLEPLATPVCNYSYLRPIGPWQSKIIMEILHHQPKAFLQTLARTCTGLGPVSNSLFTQYWISRPGDIQMGVKVEVTPKLPISSQRFCFDTTPILHTCGCDYNQQVAMCTSNPCETEMCAAFPSATCTIDFCGDCQAVWYHRGRRVDCTPDTTDPCHPNPCKNGGTCSQSQWPSNPSLTTCMCPPGYQGPTCEWTASQVCALPMDSGSCDKGSQRWFYNFRTIACEPFTYNGCAGNANNFKSLEACQQHCVMGTCCTRTARLLSALYGFSKDGYDRYGFDRDGRGKGGQPRTVDTGTRFGSMVYDQQGFDWQGFNRRGFNADGVDRQGYDGSGYRDGWNRTGWSSIGEYDGIVDYNDKGYHIDTGLDRGGFNCHGYNEGSVDYRGLSAGFRYDCFDVNSVESCKQMERSQSQLQVVKFVPGSNCGNIDCKESCGCHFLDKTYRLGQKFSSGCQTYRCSLGGAIVSDCTTTVLRKEIRELTRDELDRYQAAIKVLSTGENSKWSKLAEQHAHHVPQAYGSLAFLPWHRYFLAMFERELARIDCRLFVPYYDWTADVGDFKRAYIWQANVFGGNGEADSECVRHHPFKEAHPPFWSPCLRRKLDINIRLPDVVDIELLLKEPSYDKFRLQVEAMSSLFHQAVGGHMATPYSPYDPLFFSHYAYIDKLWDEWQSRHPDGVFQYLPAERYVPMAPFGVSPDDVFSSEDQLCVKYVSLTEGAKCNVTQPELGYDLDGYDRHGFDREGFDRDGFNRLGVNREGRPDNRGIYNVYGFDKEGYGRDGYDMSGFDRYGYDREGFNRDGFSISGFDRSGYNRYGFDMEGYTPFGFHQNGLYRPGVDESKLHQFDPYGYNIYNINRFGFNRQGFDIFGFNSQGYDARNCNNYYRGPLYIRVKAWVEKRLPSVNVSTLEQISRICPQVSSLKSWWFPVYWLDRSNQESLTKQLVIDWLSRRMVDQNYRPRSTSVTSDRLWLPIDPDARLCLVTHFGSGCPVDKPPIACDQSLCRGLTCAGHKTAVCRVYNCGSCLPIWIDGLTGRQVQCLGCVDPYTGAKREEGTSWSGSTKCEVCQCLMGSIECGPQHCPRITCNNPVTLPGQCCSTCDGCEYLGKPYVNGAEFTPPSDPCQRCRCTNGNIRCRSKECPDMEFCQSPITLPGNCCPTCLDCGDKAHGATWREDDCRTCRCENGKTTCKETKCPPVSCSHPFIPPGVCCPGCSDCLFEGKPYRHGRRFEPDPCRTCRCAYGSVRCREETCPPLNCPDTAVSVPGQCCRECPGECLYEGKTFRDGQVFTPQFNRCLNCSCSKSVVRCISRRCPEVEFKCNQPVTPLGECCPTHCPRCSHEGRQYEHGDEWSPELCTVCRCIEGSVSCQPKETCPVTCTHGIQRPGECCQQCTDCLEDGKIVKDGSRFFRRHGNTCDECFCNRGNIRCRATNTRCPRLRCTLTEIKEDQCCPICKGCIDDQGVAHDHDDKWRHPADKCSTCTCNEGRIICNKNPCPDLWCPRSTTPPGECCPVCTHCLYHGVVYEEGTFIDPNNLCLRCTCNNGEISCDRLDLLCRPDCPHPIQPIDQCCPVCDGCSYGGQSYDNGHVFYPRPDQPCYECKCTNGRVSCDRKLCPAVPCTNPVTPAGECCRQCPPGCSVSGHVYREGERWEDPRDVCSQCTCTDLTIKCEKRPCPDLQCTHPALLSGACCATCDSCFDDGRLFRHGQRFVGSNPCQECICNAGSVMCTEKTCPDIGGCKNIRHPDGVCCPECLDRPCTYNGQQVDDGAMFVDDCKHCKCNRGRMECTRIECPGTNCRHPQEGWCCSTCDGCSYAGKNFTDGQSFIHPNDPCQKCNCAKGNVVCEKIDVTCPEARCRHPWTPPGTCCPECGGGCFYEGRTYKNFQEFADRNDPCRKCVCQHGTVECGPKPCPLLDCEHPAKGECCDECNDCFYDSNRYDNGQTFRDPNNPCKTCRCASGDVTCRDKPCPPVSCSSPVRRDCCDVCLTCSYQGRELQQGESVDDRKACTNCTCEAGGLLACTPTVCPRVTCRHPDTYNCCPVCDRCFYADRVFRNGMTFRDPSDTCSDCTCQDGSVTCQKRECPELQCSRTLPGQCCPVCDERECFYDGRTYPDGRKFTDTRVRCRQCVCTGGRVTCEPVECPDVKCQHPRQEACCKSCDGCFYLGIDFIQGQTVAHPSERCKDCRCDQGTVTCSPLACDKAPCSHPNVPSGSCCPVCSDCFYEGRTFRNGQEFPDLSNRCRSCRCQDGMVTCQSRCAPVSCMHPVQGACCPECTDCLFNDQVYQHAVSFVDPNDKCQMCTCSAGTVECQHKPCPQLACIRSITVKGKCCPECRDECIYNGRRYSTGESFTDYDLCRKCECRNDIADCRPIRCETVECRHPSTDSCCPSCNDCTYESKDYRNGEVFQDSRNPCSECTCKDGTVTCQLRQCPTVTCLNPTQGKCCPVCEGSCLYRGREYSDLDIFPDPVDPNCRVCTCQLGNVTCDTKACRPVPCSHPGINNCDCPVCENCVFETHRYRNGQRFTHREDRCRSCQCLNGDVTCQKPQCPRACTHPADGDQCCPSCIHCELDGLTYRHNQQFRKPTDPCQNCVCLGGNITCTKEECPLLTCHVITTIEGACCPTCAECEFDGRKYKHEETFPHPTDDCKTCLCENGEVNCTGSQCEATQCSHPAPGQCCPQCLDCMFEGSLVTHGRHFKPDNCRDCICNRGNVTCQTETCPKLDCQLTVQEPGKCCKKCRDCIYEGQTHQSGTSWTSPSNPCMSCQCYGGVVTCSGVTCIAPCAKPIPVPGQCCARCPTCDYNGVRYKEGEVFTPSADPCDSCVCHDGNLECVRKPCPSLVDCPTEQIASPLPGECCPTCGGFSTNCTVDKLGMILRPNNDPCFTCECMENNWLCMQEFCQPLRCSVSEQVKLDGECCPRCTVCRVDGKVYPNNEKWTDASDPCTTCTCQYGEPRCQTETCGDIQCPDGSKLTAQPGRCCPQCVESYKNVTCSYEGKFYSNEDEWVVDECTKCTCKEGVSDCLTDKCPSLDCKADETPSLDPGVCCPRCIPKPATCMVYGDPHYRTFDGQTVTVQGTCKFVMATDCDTGDFTIEAHHDDRGSVGSIAWAQNLTVKIGSVHVELMYGSGVKVNGREVALPFLHQPMVHIEKQGNTILMNTNLGVKVVWDGNGYGEVSVPGSYKAKMCGLCGNFNDFPQDDLRLRSGQITTSPAVFGNSWKVEGQGICDDAVDFDPCVKAGFHVRKMSNTKCSILKSSVFSRCHRVISPEPYFASCVYDVCACTDRTSCLCDVLSSYAVACAQAGVSLQWRSPALCAMSCPETRGFIFDECGPPCARTCANKDAPLGSVSAMCLKPCVAGCQCPANKVQHEGWCIDPEDCPK